MIIAILVVIFVLVVAAFGKMSDINSKIDRLKVGMNAAMVYQIMGSPSTVDYRNGELHCVYAWEEHLRSGETRIRSLRLIFDSSSILTSIFQDEDMKI